MLKSGCYFSDMIEVAKTVAITEEEELLIVRRSQHDSKPGKWEVPGGGVEKEKPVEAAIRELEEETGLTPDTLRKQGAGELETDGRTFRFHVFLAQVSTTSVELSEEHSEHRWIQIEEHEEYDTVEGFRKDLEISGIMETNKQSENREANR